MKIFKNRILILGLTLALSLNQLAYANIIDDIVSEPDENIEESLIEEPSVEEIDENIKEDPIEKTPEVKTPSIVNNITFSDVSGHWAENIIKKAIKLGFVSGYNDGTFRPNKTITRAEFSTLLNKAMNIESTLSIDFSDVNKNDWYYEQIKKSVAVGFFSGYQDNTFKPNNPITRQEVSKVISGTITFGNASGDGAVKLKDYNSIQDWAKPSVNLAYNKGYIMGYPDKTYLPGKSLTRAEATKIIYEILDNENIEHGFNITNYNESYYGAVVVGDLNILNSVSGNINISNVVVLGNINIFAENANSIILKDVKARDIVVKNRGSVKIICNDNIYIENAKLSTNTTLEKPGSNIQIKNTVIE